MSLNPAQPHQFHPHHHFLIHFPKRIHPSSQQQLIDHNQGIDHDQRYCRLISLCANSLPLCPPAFHFLQCGKKQIDEQGQGKEIGNMGHLLRISVRTLAISWMIRALMLVVSYEPPNPCGWTADIPTRKELVGVGGVIDARACVCGAGSVRVRRQCILLVLALPIV